MRQHYLRLPGFLEPAILRYVAADIPGARFFKRIHKKGIGVEQGVDAAYSRALLELTMNDPKLFHCLAALTQLDSIGCFSGRIYRMVGGKDHHFDWHSDYFQNRLLGLTLNLSPRPYEGGVLELRLAKSKKIVGRVPNTGYGDAVLFKISPGLEHRNTPVLSGNKTAFAGWFRAADDYLPPVKAYLSRIRNKATAPRKLV